MPVTPVLLLSLLRTRRPTRYLVCMILGDILLIGDLAMFDEMIGVIEFNIS